MGEDRTELIEKEIALLKNKLLDIERQFASTTSPEVSKLITDFNTRVEFLETIEKKRQEEKKQKSEDRNERADDFTTFP